MCGPSLSPWIFITMIKLVNLLKEITNPYSVEWVKPDMAYFTQELNELLGNSMRFTKEEFLSPRIATTGNLVKCGEWCELVIKFRIPTNHLRSGRRYNPVGATFDEVIKYKNMS